MAFPKVSIIILNYNGKDYIKRCIESVLNTDYNDFEIVFVDNASTDDSLQIATLMLAHDARARIVKLLKNIGFAAGNNAGYYASKGSYVVFLNIDTEVDPDWLNKLVSVLETDRCLAAAQPKLLQIDDRERTDTEGGCIDKYGNGFPTNAGEITSNTSEYSREIFFASGAALIVKRHVLDRIGSFDPLFFLQYEDIDLCWRMRLCGYSVVLVPAAKVYHKRSAIVSGSPKPMLHFLAIRNYYVTFIKNYSTSTILRLVPFLTITRFVSIIGDLVSQSRNYLAFGHVRAIFWTFANFPLIWKKRINVQSLRVRSDGEVQKLMIDKSLTNYMRFLIILSRGGYYNSSNFYLGKSKHT